MADRIYSYDITDQAIPVTKKEVDKAIYSLGTSPNAFGDNSLTIGSNLSKAKADMAKTIIQNKASQVEEAYVSYNYGDTGTPLISKKSQEMATQSYIDWLQNERLKYMEIIFNPSTSSGSTADVSGMTEDEQAIVNNGGLIEMVKENRNLDAGSWG